MPEFWTWLRLLAGMVMVAWGLMVIFAIITAPLWVLAWWLG